MKGKGDIPLGPILFYSFLSILIMAEELTALGHRRCEYCTSTAFYKVGPGEEKDIYCCSGHMINAKQSFNSDMPIFVKDLFEPGDAVEVPHLGSRRTD